MPTNQYFNNFNSAAEQKLAEDLVIESIRIYGIDVKYCPRNIVNRNEVFNEDASSTYTSSYTIEMYVKNIEGFEGEGDLLSKFNIQIRDEITFVVAQKVYNTIIGSMNNTSRPLEGDLIYFPLTKKTYVVKFVEHEAVFYQHGSLQTYELRCELFEYSNEKLATGVPEVDAIETLYSTNVGLNANTIDANGHVLLNPATNKPLNIPDTYFDNDLFADNDEYEESANAIIDWSEKNPFQDDLTY